MRIGFVFCWGVIFGTIAVEIISVWFSFYDAFYWGILDIAVFISAIMLLVGLESSNVVLAYQGYAVGAGLLLCGTVLNLYGDTGLSQQVANLGVSAFTGIIFELARRAVRHA